MLMVAAVTAFFCGFWTRRRYPPVPPNARVEPLTWDDLRSRRETLGDSADRLPCSCPHCRAERSGTDTISA